MWSGELKIETWEAWGNVFFNGCIVERGSAWVRLIKTLRAQRTQVIHLNMIFSALSVASLIIKILDVSTMPIL